MKKVLMAMAVLALLVIGPGAATEPEGSALSAGAAKTRIEVPEGMPLAGYFNRFDAPTTGVHDPVYARALVLSCGEKRVALVNADLLLSTSELVTKLRERVSDLKLDFLVITATHTHYSLGGYVDNPLAKLAVMGGYEPEAEKIVLSSMEDALRRADRTLQPAMLGAAQGESPGVAKNRRHKGGPTDPHMRVLGVWDKSGPLLAMIVNHAIHPTIMPSKTMKASGGCTGVAESRLEEVHPGAVAMYMNAGLGD
ncbi:MAG: neutral/alkaline non-lysosomal ceramidase N-terminal domain-containing protein, partial [bacterium]